MAKRDRFFIGPLQTGLQTDLKPWLIPDDAFATLNNAFIFRGRLKKRFGTYHIGNGNENSRPLNSRLRVNVGTTDGSGDIASTVPGATFAIGQQFSIGSEIFTVVELGTSGTMSKDGLSTVHTFNTTTGAFDIQGSFETQVVYWYPAQPVMGLPSFETSAINFEPLFGFDTQFAYQFAGGSWSRLGTATWTGTDADFFWSVNYRGITADDIFFFTTNFVTADGIKYWDGTNWSVLNPVYNNAGDTIVTARIIIPFKDRLLLLNTVENIGGTPSSFLNRCRFCQNGTPIPTGPKPNPWNENINGKGGYLDAPTSQQIVSAQIIRNRLIVFFERSTWELVYTHNQIQPFMWQQINSELGVESTFSSVPFDKVVIGVGNVGIHACTGTSVERIDSKIPDEVFGMRKTNSGPKRVYGIRDYFGEMVYWTFPTKATFAQKILAYNYATGSWAFFDDSFTAFGYFQPNDSRTWETTPEPWYQILDPWSDPQYNARFRNVVAGNQQGFVSIIDVNQKRNAQSLIITSISASPRIFTVINHNLSSGDYVLIENLDGVSFTAINNKIFKVNFLTTNTFELLDSTGARLDYTGDYAGGAYLSRVSQVDVLTKDYNFYLQKGESFNLNKIDFYVDRTPEGQITVDSFISSGNLSLIDQGQATGSIVGTSILDTTPYNLVPLEKTQTRLWHPVYVQSKGQSVQLRIYLSDAQMFNKKISLSAFELHAMIFHATPGSSRLN